MPWRRLYRARASDFQLQAPFRAQHNNFEVRDHNVLGRLSFSSGIRLEMKRRNSELAAMWAHYSAQWRDTAQIASQWREASAMDPRLFSSRASGDWWDLLHSLGVTLFITREYEHLALALS